MDPKQILTIVQIIILCLILIGACLYSIPICFNHRFHTPLHLLSLNVCFAALVCCIYWSIFYIMNMWYPTILWNAQSCLPIFYLQTAVNCQVLYSLCIVSLNRLFCVVYKNKALFRTKKWVAICVCVQWIFALLIALPLLASSFTVN
jgi:hypothetical protein